MRLIPACCKALVRCGLTHRKVDGMLSIMRPSGEVRIQPSKESTSVSRIQLVLAEKRTSLAVLRTGIGVFTLPLSVITVLVATSRFYNFLDTSHLLVPLLGLCGGLVVLGVYLVHRSVRRIKTQDALINRLKHQSSALEELYGENP